MSKIVCITGCTRGLGRAMTKGFAAAGWKVAGCGRNEKALASLRSELSGDHLFAPCDTADSKAVAAFASRALTECGVPDLLLNNAAVINANAPLWKVTSDEFSRVIDVNIKGVHHVIAAFAPAMIEKGRGVIVNFSSGWGRSTSPEVAPYCATKWAIEGLSQALAQELPKGMASIALNPGVIDTDMLRSCFGESAGGFAGPDAWAKKAVPFLIALGARDNGKSLTVA